MLLDEHTIRIKWIVHQNKANLTRFIISYSTNNWASSIEWPGIYLFIYFYLTAYLIAIY